MVEVVPSPQEQYPQLDVDSVEIPCPALSLNDEHLLLSL